MDEHEYTYKELAEYYKKLVAQLEEKIAELVKENNELRFGFHSNPEDTYREDFTIY